MGHRHDFGGPTMGATWTASAILREGVDPDTVGANLSDAVASVDASMSTWKPQSDLNRLNTAPPGTFVDLPADLVTVLSAALDIGARSGGAFDIAVGDLTTAWGFGPPDRRPDSERIRELLKAPRLAATDVLDLDRAGGRARRTADSLFDLSGIAKGFAVDVLADRLRSFGTKDFLVAIDGEVRASGGPGPGADWLVAVENPLGGAPLTTLPLRNAALATSGDYRNRIRVGDTLLGHTMDPRRRGPAQTGLAAVTVRASTAMAADAWATALMVLGETDGLRVACEAGIEAGFVVRDGDGIRLSGMFAVHPDDGRR